MILVSNNCERKLAKEDVFDDERDLFFNVEQTKWTVVFHQQGRAPL